MSAFAIRVDDLGWSPTPVDPAPMKATDVGLELAQRFHAAMSGLPYLAAIIPACVDAAGLEWLRSKPQGMTPALHGWDHYPVGGARGEFRGHTLDGMRSMLERGRRHLGLEVEHLVPPFNACEADLAEACALEGIKYVWGGGSHGEVSPSTWAQQPPPYPWGRVTFIPSWSKTYGATRWKMSPDGAPLLSVLGELLRQPGKVCLVLHCTWECAKDPNFDGVRELVELIGENIISPAEYVEE